MMRTQEMERDAFRELILMLKDNNMSVQVHIDYNLI